MRHTYEYFKRELLMGLRQLFGSDYDFEFYTARRNNSVEFDSLRIFQGEKEIHSGISLQEYYIAYQSGKTIHDISFDIFQFYDACWNANMQTSNSIFPFSILSSNLIFRLISQDKNQIILNKVPHILFFDFAITFHRLICMKEDNIITSCVTLEECKEWNLTEQELFQISLRNMPNLLPSKLHTMEEMILGLMDQEFSEYTREDSVLLQRKEGHTYPMYVLTNSLGIHGAASILYPGLLDECYKMFSSEFFILPSSVHELILVPFTEDLKQENLRAMVLEVNESHIAEEDFLSNTIYSSIDFRNFGFPILS